MSRTARSPVAVRSPERTLTPGPGLDPRHARARRPAQRRRRRRLRTVAGIEDAKLRRLENRLALPHAHVAAIDGELLRVAHLQAGRPRSGSDCRSRCRNRKRPRRNPAPARREKSGRSASAAAARMPARMPPYSARRRAGAGAARFGGISTVRTLPSMTIVLPPSLTDIRSPVISLSP